ncbi:MAG TPA: glucose 1-dehydrogenase [Acidimicrobiales bacterium]|mgnify:CR=1 FL=1
MTGKLEGRVALISGIASGLGRAGARLFAAEGAAVVGLDVDADGASRTVAEIVDAGGTGAHVQGDAAQAADVQRAVREAVARYGKLDLLWANAGIGVFKDVVDTTESEWDRIVGVNLKGAYLMAHFGIPELRRAGGGTMVLTASTSAVVGSPRWAAYCATKGGMLMLCRAMALDHATEGIRINCVCPGSIDTPLLEQDMRSRGVPIAEAIEQDRRAHPMGRVGRPDEVARAALFLSCDDSSFTTGSALFVDGGYAAQ